MKNRFNLSLTFMAVLILSSLFLSGCGYTTRSMITNKYRTIYVKPFVNKIDVSNEVSSANRYKIYRPMV